MVKNQGTKQREQRTLGDCWQWITNGQCVKGNNCSFRHDMNKRGKMTQPNLSPSCFMQQNERSIEKPKSQGKEPQWWNVSMALEGLPQRNLQQLIL